MPATRTIAILAAIALLGAAGPSRADEAGGKARPDDPSPLDLRPRLTLDLPFHAALTGTLLLAAGASSLLADRLAAPACRWCEPNPFDRWARQELRWTHPNPAGTISDVMVDAIPVGALVALGLTGRAQGAGARELAEDLVVVTEAVSVATVLTQVSKLATGRLRPDAWAGGGVSTPNGRMSFWGGHAAFAFSVAAGATQLARMRGRPGWKWLAVLTFAGAATTSWLRVAADRHWLTDIIVGAGVGTAAGLAVPLMVLRPASERAPAVTLAPAPGGFALRF